MRIEHPPSQRRMLYYPFRVMFSSGQVPIFIANAVYLAFLAVNEVLNTCWRKKLFTQNTTALYCLHVFQWLHINPEVQMADYSQDDRMDRKAAAEFLGVSPAMLADDIRKGKHKFPYSRIGSRVFYSRRQLTAWREAHTFNKVAA